MNDERAGKGWAEGWIDIYGSHIHLAYTKAGARRNRRVNPELDAPLEGGGWVQDSKHEPSGVQHIWVFINTESASSQISLIDTIAHEAFHVAEAIGNHCNFRVTDETGAFLVGYLTGWIWARIPEDLHAPQTDRG